jgi:hypothetical protein
MRFRGPATSWNAPSTPWFFLAIRAAYGQFYYVFVVIFRRTVAVQTQLARGFPRKKIARKQSRH